MNDAQIAEIEDAFDELLGEEEVSKRLEIILRDYPHHIGEIHILLEGGRRLIIEEAYISIRES